MGNLRSYIRQLARERARGRRKPLGDYNAEAGTALTQRSGMSMAEFSRKTIDYCKRRGLTLPDAAEKARHFSARSRAAAVKTEAV